MFIANWVSPAAFMVLGYYDTDKYNYITPYLPLIVALGTPLAYLNYVENPRLRGYYYYGYAVFIIMMFLTEYYGYNLPKALSVSALTMLVSSYFWEAPWLLRNAWVRGWENDWVLHLFVLFYVWYLHDAVGFKATPIRVLFSAAMMAVCIGWMLGSYDYVYGFDLENPLTSALLWNSTPFMMVRAVGLLGTLPLLDLEEKH